MEAVLSRPGRHRATQVGALLAVRDEAVLRGADEDAGVLRLWIGERDGACDGDGFDVRNASDRMTPLPPPGQVLERDPDLARDEREARQDEELREVSAGDELVLRPVDREVVPPLRLVVVRTPIRRDGELVGGAGAQMPSKTFASISVGSTGSS